MDNGTDKVYQYAAAAGRTSGSQNASATFALASGNTNPQGIADPPPAFLMTPLTPTNRALTETGELAGDHTATVTFLAGRESLPLLTAPSLTLTGDSRRQKFLDALPLLSLDGGQIPGAADSTTGPLDGSWVEEDDAVFDETIDAVFAEMV